MDSIRSSDKAAIISSRLWRCLAVFVLLILLLSGCQESYLQKSFPPELVSRARSNFETDITDWDIPVSQAMTKRVRLVVQRAWGVNGAVQDYCEQKLAKYLDARGFELDPNAPTKLIVYIVKASEIQKPVRSAKVRIAVKLCANESAEPILCGIADGIIPRPDLSWGVWMPKTSYFRAAQHAISKLMHQLDNMSKSSPSCPDMPCLSFHFNAQLYKQPSSR